MKFGTMNNPLYPILDEIKFIGTSKFDFIELAVEAPLSVKKILSHKKEIKDTLSTYQLSVIEHVPCFVSTADLYESIRKASQKEILNALTLTREFGIKKVVIHPSYIKGLGRHLKERIKKIGYEFLVLLYERAKELGIHLCLENMMPPQGWLVEPDEFKPILKDLKDLKLTLDIGHANVMCKKNRSLDFIKFFRKRIEHVHVSDNSGVRDEHLPPGCGKINFDEIFTCLKKAEFNDTMTLEVFTKDRDYLNWGLQKTKELWKKA